MKTVGILGGMSWPSTVTYYQQLNMEVAKVLGAPHAAKILLHSVDFAEVERLQKSGGWQQLGDMLTAAALGLQNAGAGLMLIASNTMHKVAGQVQAAIGVPLLHIADATADALIAAGVAKAGLLGSRATMTQDFIKERLLARGLEVLLPEPPEMDEVDRIIFEELAAGDIREGSRGYYRGVMDSLARKGAEGIILGCTEIGLLVDAADSARPLFDTALIHARRAAALALED